jgi:hypothetical protein
MEQELTDLQNDLVDAVFKFEHMKIELISDYDSSLILPAISDPDYLRSTIIPALETGYGIVGAQAANAYFRSDPLSPPATVTARLVDAGRQRLVQSEISTRILEGVIAVMLVCVLVVFATSGRADRLVPKCPCSIAALASLLAGSRMLDAIPDGAEWWSEKEAKEQRFFDWEDGYGIGLWANGVDMPDRFGIDRNPRMETHSESTDMHSESAGDGESSV